MSYVKFGAIVFSLFVVTSFVSASEPDEIREKAKAVQREAIELAELGRNEEAANLKRQATTMLEEADRLQRDHLQRERLDQGKAKIMRLRRSLEELRHEEDRLRQNPDASERLANVRRRAQQVESELEGLSDESHRQQAAPHHEIVGRLEHMRIAVEHLHHSGLHDVAEKVAQQAEAMERELHERQKHPSDKLLREMMKQLDQIRDEVGRLRGEVNELKERRDR